MDILHLTLKKKWFDMILSGEKTEEYRENKPYWWARLELPLSEMTRHYDAVKFTNGYSKTSPSFLIECKGISKGMGNPHWGAPFQQKVFIIKLGKIIANP